MEEGSLVQIRREKRSLNKNIFAVFFPLFLACVAQKPVIDLQSSLNRSLGTLSMSVAHGCGIFALLFLPQYVIGIFGAKRCVMVCHFLLVFFILANIFPTPITMMGGTILGLGFRDIASVGQNELFREFGVRFAELYGISTSKGINFLSSLLNSSISFGYVVGNLLSFVVLNADVELVRNVSDQERLTCGVFFIEGRHEDTGHFRRPEPLYVIVLFVSLAIVAVISVIFTGFLLDPSPTKPWNWKDLNIRKLMSTLDLNRDWRFPCLFINNFHNGLLDAFIGADINKTFATCLLGIQFVGVASTCFGLGLFLSSIVYAFVAKRNGRLPVFFFHIATELALLLFSLLWVPSLNYDYLTVFVPTFLWGWVHSGTRILPQAVHGVLPTDKTESSFSHFHVAVSCGMMVGNAYSGTLPLTLKIYIMFAFMTLSFLSYLAVEINIRMTNKN